MLQRRRDFLALLPMVPAAFHPRANEPRSRVSQAAGALRIDAARLRARLEHLSTFGRPAGGTFADGVSRLGYSQADVAARAWFIDQMRQAGLNPRVDAAGNIFGRREGRDPALTPVLFGSHIDSVPNGGNFDGDVGSLAALEILQICQTHRIMTQRPLEMVVWANEEGVAFGNGLCGSRAAAGKLVDGELDHIWNGVKKSDAIREIGGDPSQIERARRPEGSFACYLELHIEQGGHLDREGIPIGIVEGIVAIDRYAVTIRGVPNHAGTTPMPDRQDALIAASHLTLAVREIVTGEQGRQVGTVGQLHVTPNAPNVIPGEVSHTIELRDLSAEKIARLAESIRVRARQIAHATRTQIEMTRSSHHEAAIASPAVQTAIEAASKRVGLTSRRLPSGAGHDAQMMARLGPMGMIFIPSVGGISHSPHELTSWEDCARGADVLLHTVLAFAEPS